MNLFATECTKMYIKVQNCTYRKVYIEVHTVLTIVEPISIYSSSYSLNTVNFPLPLA